MEGRSELRSSWDSKNLLFHISGIDREVIRISVSNFLLSIGYIRNFFLEYVKLNFKYFNLLVPLETLG